VQGTHPSERIRHSPTLVLRREAIPVSNGLAQENRSEPRLRVHGQNTANNGYVFEMDVVPDIKLGPIREREHSNAFVLSIRELKSSKVLGADFSGPIAHANHGRSKSSLLPAIFFIAAGPPNAALNPPSPTRREEIWF